MLYLSQLDEDKLSEMIEKKYPAIYKYLSSPDTSLISEILLYPHVQILKSLIKTKFPNLKNPENLLILLRKLLPHNQAVTVLFINILRYCDKYPFIRKWIIKSHDKYGYLFKNTAFLEFYKFVIENEVEIFSDFFIKLTPQLEKKILFFLNVDSNHDFYLELLLKKEVKSWQTAENVCHFLLSQEICQNSFINKFECAEKFQNIEEISQIIYKIKNLTLKSFFEIIRQKKKL